jgi:hypothetical protein
MIFPFWTLMKLATGKVIDFMVGGIPASGPDVKGLVQVPITIPFPASSVELIGPSLSISIFISGIAVIIDFTYIRIFGTDSWPFVAGVLNLLLSSNRAANASALPLFQALVKADDTAISGLLFGGVAVSISMAAFLRAHYLDAPAFKRAEKKPLRRRVYRI